MKLEVKKVDALKRELKFEVPKDRVAKTLEGVYQEISKVAKVRGFRPGKVPRHMLETSHGAIAREETIKKLIPEVYHEGLVSEKINPIDMPEIHDVNLKDGILTFTAKLEVRPEVKLGEYKGIKIHRKSSQVTEEEIDKTLEFFKKGQEKEDAALDDTFAKSIGYPTLEEFKQALKRQLEFDKDRQNRADIENQIVDNLLKHAKLIAPETLLKKELEYRIYEAKKHLKSHKQSDDEIKKKEDELREKLPEVVEKDVKVYLILQEIAQKEDIRVQEGEHLTSKVMELLLKEAKWEDEKQS